MKYLDAALEPIRRLFDFQYRLLRWLADRLGLWRIDVGAYLAHAIQDEKLAAEMEASGLGDSARPLRKSAARWRGRAEQRRPAR
jgi:hypothetical protein